MIVGFLLMHPSLFGQGTDLPQIIPPSPTAAALGEYGDIPVSYYTGVPNISIPLYNIQSRDISVPISLSYHAGGVKVEEEASWVGLGWSLNAGGVITRSVRGLDDIPLDGYPFDMNPPMPNSDANNNYDLMNTQPTDLNYFSALCAGNQDGEPDLFYFNFGGYSGKFVLLPGSDASDLSVPPDVKVMLLSQDKIKVEALHHTYTGPLDGGEARLDWKVTTPDGFAYYFQVQEITKMKTGSGISEATADQVFTSLDQPYTVNSWYMSQIESPTGEIVTFTYEEDDHGTKSMLSRSQEHVRTVRGQAYCTHIGSSCSFPSANCTNNGSTYSASMRVTKDVYLERIDFTNGYIEFTTGARDDMEKEEPYHADPQRLEQIHVHMNGNPVRTFTLNYDYFHPASTDVKRKRLKLLSVTESNGSLSKPAHTFEYYSSTHLANKDSKNQDHWGYHNGAYNYDLRDYQPAINTAIPSPNLYAFSTLIPATELLQTSPPVFPGYYDEVLGYDEPCVASAICDPNSLQYDAVACNQCWTDYWAPHYYHGADREPDKTSGLTYMKTASLKRINYPTGGYSEFDYEAHDYGNIPVQDIWENYDTTVTDCGPNKIPGPDCSFNASETIVLTEPAFVLLDHNVIRSCGVGSGGGGGSGCSPVDPWGPQDFATLTGPGTDLRFHYSQLHLNTAINQYTYHYLQPGTYTLTAIAVDDAYVRIDAKWSNPKLPIEPLLAKRAGGLRIKTVTTNDGSSTNDLITAYRYTKIDGGVEKSSGKLMAPLEYGSFQLQRTIGNVGSYFLCHNFILSSSSSIPLGSSANGSIVGYDEVTVLRGLNGENGKTVYNYFNTAEEVADVLMPGLPTRIYNSNGLLGVESHYRKTSGIYKIVSQTETHYNGKKYTDNLIAINPASNTISVRGIKYYGLSCIADPDIIFQHIPQVKFYETVSEWWRPTKKIERTFDQNNFNWSLETVTDYVYYTFPAGSGKVGHLREEIVTNSDGSTLSTEYGYPEDFTVGSSNPIQMMIDKNIVAVPIEVLQKKDDAVISGTFTEYKIENGNVLPGKTHLLETTTPISGFVPTRFSHAPASGSEYEERIEFSQYDPFGNLLSVKQTTGQPVSYIWGHDEALPIAQAQNAIPGDIAYTSFEEFGNYTPGGWTLVGDGIGGNGWSNSTAKTGNRSYQITVSGSLLSPVNSAGTYTLSYWVNGPNPTTNISGSLVQSSGPDPLGFTYYEYEIDLAAGQTLILSGNSTAAKIDEVRLYPKEARMSTICYDANLRIHTMTDVNNYSTYYEYDDLGRLVSAKDQDGNLLQTYDYHFKQ